MSSARTLWFACFDILTLNAKNQGRSFDLHVWISSTKTKGRSLYLSMCKGFVIVSLRTGISSSTQSLGFRAMMGYAWSPSPNFRPYFRFSLFHSSLGKDANLALQRGLIPWRLLETRGANPTMDFQHKSILMQKNMPRSSLLITSRLPSHVEHVLKSTTSHHTAPNQWRGLTPHVSHQWVGAKEHLINKALLATPWIPTSPQI